MVRFTTRPVEIVDGDWTQLTEESLEDFKSQLGDARVWRFEGVTDTDGTVFMPADDPGVFRLFGANVSIVDSPGSEPRISLGDYFTVISGGPPLFPGFPAPPPTVRVLPSYQADLYQVLPEGVNPRYVIEVDET